MAKLDVDKNPVIASKYRIMSIPTMGVFVEGKMVDKVIGFMPKEHLVEKMLKYLK